MLKDASFFAKTTEIPVVTAVIDDVLRALLIRGSLLLRESYSPPWAISVPRGDELGLLLGLPADSRAIAFHLVEYGHAELIPEHSDPVQIRAGDIAICFGGAAHRISGGRAARTQPVGALLAGKPNVQHPDRTGQPAAIALICGVFQLHHAEFNPLLGAVPGIVHTSLARAGEFHNFAGVARLLTEELQRTGTRGGYVVERLLEVLCAEAVRAHVESAPRDAIGWVRGIRDASVGRAILAVHASPGADWSVARLAQQVAMSPSRFAARFAEATGASPMAYVTRWRMNVACRMLAASRQAVDRIAADVGYQSAAAFNRAFKKFLGLPPAAWRAAHGSGARA